MTWWPIAVAATLGFWVGFLLMAVLAMSGQQSRREER